MVDRGLIVKTIRDEIVFETISREGGYVNDPDDSGGETNYGITKNVAVQHGYDGEMRDLPKKTAIDIYVNCYWDKIKGDDILQLSEHVAGKIFDCAVNMGVNRASKFLQRALNSLTTGDDLEIDGHIGAKTTHKMGEYLQHRDPITLVKLINCIQGSAYLAITENRPKDKKFLYGWIKNRITL